ncbi:MAG: D-Ala-D-Ala carboxypeptidase family metallohydrolase [Thainema sp.]
MTQLETWRSLAANTLEPLIRQIPNATLNNTDALVDDLLRSLGGQPPRPAGTQPYVGLFGQDSVQNLRRRAAAGIRIYLERLDTPTVVTADEQADRLIRTLRGFAVGRPEGVYPYEGLYGYTDANVSSSQLNLWRQQAGDRLQELISGIPNSDPTPADDLADSLLRALGSQPPRPPGRRPYEGLIMLPSSAPFLEYRRRGASALQLFVERISDPRLGSKDAVVDDVIRKISTVTGVVNLPSRPINRLPYEGLFGRDEGNIQLSRNFTLQDLIRSATADRLGIDNTPSPAVVANLRRLVQQILQPAWDVLGPLTITSGYRSPQLNAAVGGVPNSDHLSGYAADVVPVNGGTRRFAEWVVDNVPFDQVILEFGTLQSPAWIHVSADPDNRRQIIRQDSSGSRFITL